MIIYATVARWFTCSFLVYRTKHEPGLQMFGWFYRHMLAAGLRSEKSTSEIFLYVPSNPIHEQSSEQRSARSCFVAPKVGAVARGTQGGMLVVYAPVSSSSPFIHLMDAAGLLPMAVQVSSVSLPSLTTSSRLSMIGLPGGTDPQRRHQ